MSITKPDQNFRRGLEKLGFSVTDDALYLTSQHRKLPDPQIQFHIEKARDFGATAVFLRLQLNGSYKPQAYLYDFTGRGFEENELTDIQKVIWSSGEAPLACIFYDTEIKILNCTTHINDDNTPVYLVKNLQIVGATHKLYNEQFAVKIKSGLFWEIEENKNKFRFQNSSYDKLITNIRYIVKHFQERHPNIAPEFINKIIIQSILIKYLEERIDDDGNKLLSNKYFKKYDKANTFNDVLRRPGRFVDLIDDLNDPRTGFNGNVFQWTNVEKDKLRKVDLALLAELLENQASLVTGQRELWRYFEFKYIPVELISRLYEEFLGQDKKDKGLYFTPSHLAKLLVDESIPLKRYKEIDLESFKVLDPACGSGIFLVVTFKRLVQVWRLQNDMAVPELSDLKNILKNLYGIDQEEQAVHLASFSLCLALCNELKPIDIINKLKFDDLIGHNLINHDFFTCSKLNDQKFDLIIGNPPFGVGAIKNYSPYWKFDKEKVGIPQGQIALKFLSESIPFLKEKGLLCLIIKASGLLYNVTSSEYKKLLFSKLNVVQILDFTGLGRNKALWDNGADVASAAIFLRNEKPDFRKNILHLTFRRTRATKERIAFEIDDYDLHFINRQIAIHNDFIWKNNLLGGGRIQNLVAKFSNMQFENFLNATACAYGEGFKIGSHGDLDPDYIYELPSLPTEGVTEEGIDLNDLFYHDKSVKFEKIPEEEVFTAPNIIIWENIGQKRIPIHFNRKTSFSFQHKVIGIANQRRPEILNVILKSFETFNDFYRFYIYVTSGQLLINLNTTILKKDIMQIPFIEEASNNPLSGAEINIINDVNTYMQSFLRHGEGSLAVKPIHPYDFQEFMEKYGQAFSSALNDIYQTKKKSFRLTDVVELDNNFVATVFKYSSADGKPKFHSTSSTFDLQELTDHELSKHLSIKRIIKFYPAKDVVVLIKPNQHRYWISLIAYRDADKCVSDLAKLGY